MPLVSVVVPTHNVEPYIARCLTSILSGAGDMIEVIVVDDASTDGTRSAIETIAADDKRIQLLTHATGLGAGLSRNDGLAAATGEYVWFVDGDDWLLDGALEHILPRLRGGVDVLFVNHVVVWENGTVVEARPLAEAPSTPFTLRQWPEIVNVLHVPWNKIVKRSLLVDHSIAFRVGVGSDIAFTYQVLPAARAIEVEQYVSYAWRTGRPGQLTRVAGDQHLVWSDQWRAALDSVAGEPIQVRAAIFNKMVRHGWYVLAHPIRLQGALREEFFRGFSALYRDRRGPGLTRDVILGSRSWTLARVRLLLRRVSARHPASV